MKWLCKANSLLKEPEDYQNDKEMLFFLQEKLKICLNGSEMT